MAEPCAAGTVTFVFTDIEGSTRLWEEHPKAMGKALARHDAILREAIETHRGCVFKTVGDAFYAVFPTASDALQAALTAQCNLCKEPWPETTPVRVRMALHTGAAEERGGDYFGVALNRVARLLDIALGQQVLLSDAARSALRGPLPEGASLSDLGSHRLKDLDQPEHVFQMLHPALPACMSSLRSLQSFAHNLPVQLTSFTGREQELGEVRSLLGEARLLTLTGSGGVGKTRLALQVAADRLEHYPNGVWLVELAPLSDGSLLPQTMAAALGVREEPGRALLQTLAGYLQPKTSLIVLDNCEHLLCAAAHLAEALLRACPDLCLLATSREGLAVAGETVYRVPSLSVPDTQQWPLAGSSQRSAPDRSSMSAPPECGNPSLATDGQLAALLRHASVRLFAERAAAALPSFRVTPRNAAAIALVCQRLDGIPLAIELAAARVRVMPVERISERLDDRFRLLTGGSRTALPRQQTLRALIDWSYDLLFEPERTIFRRLSVFACGCTPEAAEAVCGDVGKSVDACAPDQSAPTRRSNHPPIQPDEVLGLLTQLVEKSLLIYEEVDGEARYRMLETVRQYARDRLLERGEAESLRGRHLDWVLRLAEEAGPELQGPDQAEWLARLELEHDNLRAGLAWCQEDGKLESGLRLGAALGRFWWTRCHLAEGRDNLAKLLALSGGAGSPELRAQALQAAVWLANRSRDYATARALNEECLALWRGVGNQQRVAWALHEAGVIALEQGDPELGRAYTEQALELARGMGDQRQVALELCSLGEAARYQNDYLQAALWYEESLALMRPTGDEGMVAMLLHNLGHVALADTELPDAPRRAGALFREGLAISQRLQWRDHAALCLAGLAGVMVVDGSYTQAVRLCSAAATALEDLGAAWWGADRAAFERYVAAAREQLSEAEFATQWSAGSEMALEEALTCALGESLETTLSVSP